MEPLQAGSQSHQRRLAILPRPEFFSMLAPFAWRYQSIGCLIRPEPSVKLGIGREETICSNKRHAEKKKKKK
jgi:hypothetical protein